jgi:phosphoglycolate phosphatase
MSRLRGLLFDLDGVLIDSLPSITACMNHALAQLGRPALDPAMIRPLIGPPLEDSAALLLGTSEPAQVAAFVALYRERYAATCVAETLPAAGLREVLSELSRRWPLALATSKPEVFARLLLDSFAVSACFQRGGIYGRSLALDSEDKAAVIARALLMLGGAEGLVMIGDRKHDVIGAAAHAIPTIGVLHGMGSREELEQAGARWICDDLWGLPALLERIDAGDDDLA